MTLEAVSVPAAVVERRIPARGGLDPRPVVVQLPADLHLKQPLADLTDQLGDVRPRLGFRTGRDRPATRVDAARWGLALLCLAVVCHPGSVAAWPDRKVQDGEPAGRHTLSSRGLREDIRAAGFEFARHLPDEKFQALTASYGLGKPEGATLPVVGHETVQHVLDRVKAAQEYGASPIVLAIECPDAEFGFLFLPIER